MLMFLYDYIYILSIYIYVYTWGFLGELGTELAVQEVPQLLAIRGLGGPRKYTLKMFEGDQTAGEPVAYTYGLFSVKYGLLWGIVAYYFGLLGCPGST